MQAQKPSNPNTLAKLFHICLVLMLFFFVTNIILGVSNKKLALDIEILEVFLGNAVDVRPNFEESLNLYTEGTQDSIEYVQTLRPSSEQEYIQFISSVEAIGQELSLSVNLESLEVPKPDNLGEILRYRIDFFGGQHDLLAFLRELEALPYYIRIEGIQYESLEFIGLAKVDLNENIVLTIQLYVR